MESIAPDWVSETRFGKWFQSTDTWFTEVLSKAVADLRALGGATLPASFDRFLDVGCGQGLGFPLLVKHFNARHITGVEVDPYMLKLATMAAQKCSVPAEVRAASVTKLDVPDASFDGVLCHQLIHHVSDQAGALRELLRVLKPGGYLFLSESCAPFINTWTVKWFFRHPDGVQQRAEGYLKLVREAGFLYDDRRDVNLSTPWWSLWDFGITRKVGLVRTPPEITELLLVARKAGS